MTTVIIQGDQYYIPIIITQGETEITDQNVDDVKIKVDAITKKASDGDISYSAYAYGEEEKHAWLFPVTQLQTLSWKAGVIPITVRP